MTADRPRRGCLTGLIALVVIIGGLLVAADVAAKSIASHELERRLRRAVPEAESVGAGIESFPFLLKLFTGGKVSGVDAQVNGVTVDRLRFQSIKVSLHDVKVDKDELLRNQRAVLLDIGRGEVRAEIGEADISAYVGVPVRLDQGKATGVFGGVPITVDIAVENSQIVVKAGPLSVSPSSLVPAPLLPCAEGLRVERGKVVIVCPFDDIPPELLTEAQRRAGASVAGGRPVERSSGARSRPTTGR